MTIWLPARSVFTAAGVHGAIGRRAALAGLAWPVWAGLCGPLLAGLAGCGGVPLRSLPRLVRLSGQMLEADPAEVVLALQVDARLLPPPGAQAWLLLHATPKQPGAFEPIRLRLPLQLGEVTGAASGLAPAPAGRRWLLLGMPAHTQTELRRVQALVKRAMQATGPERGGTLAMGIEQAELAAVGPALDHTRWQTWLQVSRAEGFFPVWEGTPADIRRAARDQGM